VDSILDPSLINETARASIELANRSLNELQLQLS